MKVLVKRSILFHPVKKSIDNSIRTTCLGVRAHGFIADPVVRGMSSEYSRLIHCARHHVSDQFTAVTLKLQIHEGECLSAHEPHLISPEGSAVHGQISIRQV